VASQWRFATQAPPEMDRRSGASEIEYLIYLDIKRKRNVKAHQFKISMVKEMSDIFLGPGKEVIDTKDVVPLIDKPFT
jgi:hypothetical protein